MSLGESRILSLFVVNVLWSVLRLFHSGFWLGILLSMW